MTEQVGQQLPGTRPDVQNPAALTEWKVSTPEKPGREGLVQADDAGRSQETPGETRVVPMHRVAVLFVRLSLVAAVSQMFGNQLLDHDVFPENLRRVCQSGWVPGVWRRPGKSSNDVAAIDQRHSRPESETPHHNKTGGNRSLRQKLK